MPTLTADVKLRLQVLSDPNVILVTEPGYQDKVIRVFPIPECARVFHEEQLKDRERYSEFKSLKHLQLDLSRGPEQELWRNIEREIFMLSDRNKPMATVVAVSNKLGDPWGISLDEVPEIVLSVETKPRPEVKAEKVEEAPLNRALKCECGFQASTDKGLKVHKSRKHGDRGI